MSAALWERGGQCAVITRLAPITLSVWTAPHPSHLSTRFNAVSDTHTHTHTRTSQDPALRAVCREWRATYDAAAAGLRARWVPGGAGISGGGSGNGNGSDGSSSRAAALLTLPPLRFPSLRRCEVVDAPAAELARVLEAAFAVDEDAAAADQYDGGYDGSAAATASSSGVTELVVCRSPDATALPACVVERGARLVALVVNDTALATLPTAGLERLAALTRLDVARNALVQLPASLAAALPRLQVLRVQGNLLTELPPALPRALRELDVSSNRLKTLTAAQVAGLTALTRLGAVAAFSHRPHGEGSAAVGALAALARLRDPGAPLSLLCDRDVAMLLRARLAWTG